MRAPPLVLLLFYTASHVDAWLAPQFSARCTTAAAAAARPRAACVIAQESSEEAAAPAPLESYDDAEARLLLGVRGGILPRRPPQAAAPCRTLCRVTSVCSAAVQRAESAPLSFALSSNAVEHSTTNG